jgi:hypothetical protein
MKQLTMEELNNSSCYLERVDILFATDYTDCRGLARRHQFVKKSVPTLAPDFEFELLGNSWQIVRSVQCRCP